MTPVPHIDRAAYFAMLDRTRQTFHAEYYAMYSSVLGGIVKDPLLMTVPVDDHMVHRGDGVFETLKCVAGGIYALQPHLDRLFTSASRVGLKPAWSKDEIGHIVAETVRAGGHRDTLIRILLSRGSGSLGVSPYDCAKPGLFVVVHALKPAFMEAHPEGARACTSSVPVKSGTFANIKSCNYLPNAMMKKEAADKGCDFALAFDERGFIAEGATENFGIVTSDRRLVIPRNDRILAGTTMQRVVELARAQGVGTDVRDIARAELDQCVEMLIFGTTPDVTSVVTVDGKPVGDGKPGPVRNVLTALLDRDIREPGPWRTEIF